MVVLKASARDGRLDVLRGLCLLDMVLIHLLEQHIQTPWAVGEIAMHWLRFAAGGFVMTSGLCIGVIHYTRALDPTRRAATYVSLLKRALFVLGIHYFASILELILIPIQGRPVFNVGTMLWEVLTFRAGYDLLLFYVFMLAVSPLIIEAVRRLGGGVVLAASLALFLGRWGHPYLSLWAIERDFPLIHWQSIFIIGLVIGSKLTAYDALPARRKWQLLGVAAMVAIGVDTLSAVERANALALPWWLTVTKLPLSPLELVRYVAIAVAAGVLLDRSWKWFGDSAGHRVLAAVGAQSLMLWVAHVPIVANVAPLPWPVAMVAAWALVWMAAVAGTWLTRQWSRHAASLPRLAYVVPAVGSLLITAALLRLETPRSTDLPLASAEASDESVFFTGDGTDIPIPVDDDSISDVA